MFLTIASQACGQEESSNTSGQFIGVQVNQLIRQILNFSSAGFSVDNPYLITFSSNSSATGRGINLGLGYTVNHFQDGDAFTRRHNEVREFSLRIGWERKLALSSRWIVSYGLDAVLESDNNWTKTSNGSNDFSVETTTTRNGRGLGPRFTLNFQLTDRILIGTEASYYLISGKDENEVRSTFRTTEIDPVTGRPRVVTHTEINDSSEKFRRFSLDAPSVIFLIVKL